MKLRSLLPVFAFVLLLFSCSKDFDATSTWSGPRLSRVLVNGVVTGDFEYDSNGRLIRKTSYFDAAIRSSESKRYYDNTGKLIKIENAFNVSSTLTREQMDSGYSEMSYDNLNRLVETKNYHIVKAVATYTSRSVPEYDAEGRVIAVTLYNAATNLAYAKNTYQYNSQNNIISGDFFQYSTLSQALNSHYVYEYDNQQNPYKDITVMPHGVNANNITKQIVTNYTSVAGSATTNTSVTIYKNYNSNGYPTLVNENGVDYVYEYK